MKKSLCLALGLAALLFWPQPAPAARYNVDITCEQMSQLPPETMGQLAFWLPGWWSARHNDPYINAWRVSLLAEHLADACMKSRQGAYILATVRQFNKMPAVPDNGLEYSCRNFLKDDDAWRYMLTMWLQGYVAGEKGDVFMNDGFEAIISSYDAQCRRDEKQNMGQVARKVGQRAR